MFSYYFDYEENKVLLIYCIYIFYKIVVLIKKFYNIRVNKCDVWVWIGNIVWFEMLDIVVYKLIGCLLI